MTDTIATYLMMLLRMSIQVQAQGEHRCWFRYYEDGGRVTIWVYPNANRRTDLADWICRPEVVHIRSSARIGARDSDTRTYPATEAAVIACLERAATELKAYVDGSISDPIQEARHAA